LTVRRTICRDITPDILFGYICIQIIHYMAIMHG
jgi:hypothetical protein